MVKVAVLGAAGQLGQELCKRLPWEVTALTRNQANLTQPATLQAALKSLHPDLVINCAAYNLVDQAEREPEAALAVNAWGVRNLALLCAELDCLLVHFSTDYVFGLEEGRQNPWTEGDPPGPVNIYGLSKLMGEYLVRTLVPRHLIIRTCGLYGLWGRGGKGTNFVETMLRLAQKGQPLRVVADQRCTPTYTADLAEATARLIQAGENGLFHVTNSGSCTWHELAQAIMAHQRLGVEVQPITTKEFGAAARRPRYSVLANERFVQRGLPPLRPWRDALAAYLQERKKTAKG